MPGRFVRIDLVDRLSPYLPEFAAQAIVGLACAVLAVLARGIVDIFFSGAGPFALTFPFVLFATLFGRWGAGIGMLCFSAVYAWYFVLPIPQSFSFANPTDGPRVAVNVLSGFLIVAMAEYFRRLVRVTLIQRDDIAEERRLLLAELDHRVKNNFAMVGAMIRMELRASPEAAKPSLKAIHSRVDSIARAHESLYRGEGKIGEVPMRPYLTALGDSLKSAYLQAGHSLSVDAADVALPRDDAVGIGLLVNELCINAAKYAFPDRSDGQIRVDLTDSDDALTLSVSDDGVGMKEESVRQGSLGQGLISALAEQVGGTLERVPVGTGTKFKLVVPRHPG